MDKSSNFKGSDFVSINEFGRGPLTTNRELNKLREDYCYLDRRNYDTKKPLNFITYQYRPYQTLTESGGIKTTCNEGYYYWDGKIGPFTVDGDSKLKFEGLTRGKGKHQLDNLRPNAPRARGCHCPDEESDLTIGAEFSTKAKGCSDSVEVYLPYQWQYFNHLGYNPNDHKHVVNEHYMRAGISTTNAMRESYLSGDKACFKNINKWKL